MAQRKDDLEERLSYELDPDLQHELLKHPGRWVAMTRSVLVAVGDSPAEVLRDAHAAGYEHPILYRVPEPGSRVYFY